MKQILFNEPSRQALQRGVELLCNAVKVTLGGAGRNVLIAPDLGGPPKATKDGITVARAVVVNDPIEAMGADIVREAAHKTSQDAGDATSTCVVLAAAIISEGMKVLSENPTINVVELKAGIDLAVARCVEVIKEIALPVLDGEEGSATLCNIATISANGDEAIGKLISQTVQTIGRHGLISVERSTLSKDGNAAADDIRILEGMELQRGYISPHFINDHKGVACFFENPWVLIIPEDCRMWKPIEKLVVDIVTSGKQSGIIRPLLIIASDVSGELLGSLITNKVQGRFHSCCIRLPGHGDMKSELMTDLSIFCGAKVISEANGMRLESTTVKSLGTLKSVRVDRTKTLLIADETQRPAIVERVAQISAQIDATDVDGEKENMRVRIALLTGTVAVLTIGGASEIEAGERRDRIDDAICATRSAMDEGVVAGAGTTYMHCIESLMVLRMGDLHSDRKKGIEIMEEVLRAPYEQILINAGLDLKSGLYPDFDIETMRLGQLSPDYGYGMNVKTLQWGNVLEFGIIDPAKVARVALQNAASVAGTFLTTECVIGPTVKEIKESLVGNVAPLGKSDK